MNQPTQDDDNDVLNVPVKTAGVAGPALVAVKFLANVEAYNPGEVAGFEAAKAAQLIADGFAVAYP